MDYKERDFPPLLVIRLFMALFKPSRWVICERAFSKLEHPSNIWHDARLLPLPLVTSRGLSV